MSSLEDEINRGFRRISKEKPVEEFLSTGESVTRSAEQETSNLLNITEPPELPPTPVSEPPAVMPLPDSESVRRARRRSLAASRTRRGRQSTILSDTIIGDSLG